MIQNPVVQGGGGNTAWKEITHANEFNSEVQAGKYGAILFLVNGYQSFLVPYALGLEYDNIKVTVSNIANPSNFIRSVIGNGSISGASYQSVVILDESGSKTYVSVRFDAQRFQFSPGWSARYFILEG